MASSPSSCSSSSSSTPQNQAFQITLQELFAFHNIDRQLFSRFVFNLGHDPAEALHVTAFWLWLEHFNNHAHYVDNILNLPDPLVEAVFEETLLCLRAAEADPRAGFRPPNSDPLDIPMIHRITGMDEVSPWFFHKYRVLVLLGVGNIIQQVCLRAFQDLIQMLLTNRASPLYNYYFQPQSQPPKDLEPSIPSGGGTISLGGGGEVVGPRLLAPHLPPLAFYSKNLGHEMLVYYPTYNPPFGLAPSQGACPSMVGGYRDPSASTSNHSPSLSPRPSFCNPDYDPGASHLQARPQDQDIVEMFNQIHLETQTGPQEMAEDRAVPSSERTIFLTFSKGYPISESELREFLTRSFGNIIEALYMQEVGDDEQPLYARLVVADLSAMVAVLSGQSKAKFSINGKHVWARKYVRKNNPNSPPPSPN
ncbi:hypothetical protein Cgig2_009786 [Carnegiea gigantea]|uniref:Uncharacterized protein n=1 Tax=Carnegiea gigantea TaxID=171969 RepID=A0A9Q1JQ44_9CARY|nr:hypothetical protein Cgig2_009786 [Carnegiea gigantea]